MKAAYLYKLASFVRWPDGAAQGGRFRFCIVGNKEISGALAELVRGQRVEGLPASVERIDPAQPGQVRSCQIVFVGQRNDAGALMTAASGRPILTVADRSGGIRGGVVDFVMREGKVRFVIDRAMARRQQVELSSKLLETALAVE